MNLFNVFAVFFAVIASSTSASFVLPPQHAGHYCLHKRVLRRNPAKLFDPTPLGFSQVTVDSKNAVAYIAGQTALAKDGTTIQGTTVPDQIMAATENLKLAMASVGVDTPELQAEYVLKLTTYIVGYKPEYLEAIKRLGNAFGDPSNSFIGVAALATPAIKVEVEATVAIPTKFMFGLKFSKCDGNKLIETASPKKYMHRLPGLF